MHTLFRPPAEADSTIIRVADGCPWNRCTFCGMYKGVSYRAHTADQIEKSICEAAKAAPQTRRIFLADGDVLAFSFDKLQQILEQLMASFPKLGRVNSYANGRSILAKNPEELAALRKLKLTTLYLGLESGDESTLKHVNKRESPADQIAACQRAQHAGFRMSVMVLIGLAGKEGSLRHACATASVLNKIQPKLLSALRVIPVPGTELAKEEAAGSFKQVSEYEAVKELREIIAGLELKSTVFRANHSSNILPIEARFPTDKPRVIAQLDGLITRGQLDTQHPAPAPFSL